ncbi:hypothetical protein VM98_28580, partial [Streptomyces rubellomurinus subsp. indigoferus]
DKAPVFAARIAECEAALAPHVDWSLTEVLRSGEDLDRVDVVQPALWAVMVALAQLWRAVGVEPAAVVGHSQGEIAAACVAGALSLEDGARVVALRSRALLALSGKGGMVSLPLPAEEVAVLLEPYGGRIGVAALNGPSSTVVSGDADALEQLLAEHERARRIDVDYASHGPHVEQIREELLTALASITPRTADVPFHSTVTGGEVDTTTLDAEYWYTNLRQPVRFAPVVEALARQGHGSFVEVSAHPVVTVAVGECIERSGRNAVALGTLRRDEGGPQRFLLSLAEAWTAGAPVDWQTVLPADAALVDLPTYAFQRERYWLEPRPAESAVEAEFWAAVETEDLAALERAVPVDAEAWGPVLPGLAAWRRGRRERGWRYRVEWRRRADPDRPAPQGRWLLLAPPGVGADLRADDVERIEVAAADRESLARLLRDTAEGVAGVVSLLPAVGVLVLLQALEDSGVDARLWCVTRGAVSVGAGDRVTSPEQARTWGLGRVAALELPHRWGGLVDLPDGGAVDLAAVLAAAAATADEGEDQLAVRPTGTYVRRLVRAPLADPEGGIAPWTPSGTVLVTGTGSVAARVARWLLDRGAEHVALTGPVGGPDADRADLSDLGGRISCSGREADDLAGTAALVQRLAEQGRPVRAVVHTAAGTTLAPLLRATPADLAATVAATVTPAVHALDLLPDLTAAVLFTSVSGVWGTGEHAAFAAANAQLDALAEQRRAAGAPVVSVAWGVWNTLTPGGAEAEAADALARPARHGVPLLDPDRALAALDEITARGERGAVIAEVDWARFAPLFGSARPTRLFAELPEASTAAPPQAVTGQDAERAADLRRRLAAAAGPERDRLLLELVRGHAAAALGHGGAGAVAAERPFRELGFDSLIAVRLRNGLSAATGVPLPLTLVFDHPTPAALAAHLGERLGGGEAVTAGALRARIKALEEAVADAALTDDERRGIAAQLYGLLDRWDGARASTGARSVDDALDGASDDELFEFIHQEFGRPSTG